MDHGIAIRDWVMYLPARAMAYVWCLNSQLLKKDAYLLKCLCQPPSLHRYKAILRRNLFGCKLCQSTQKQGRREIYGMAGIDRCIPHWSPAVQIPVLQYTFKFGIINFIMVDGQANRNLDPSNLPHGRISRLLMQNSCGDCSAHGAR